MSNFIGRNVSVGFGADSPRGTVAVPTYWVPFDTYTVMDVEEKALDDDAYGRIETTFGADLTYQWAQGAFTGTLHDQSEGLFLKSVFGSYAGATHTGETTVKDHTFTVGNNATHPALTIASIDGNENVASPNGMISKYEVDYALGKYVSRTCDFMAAKSATASNTAALTVENKFRTQDVTLKVATTTAGLAGATAIKVKNAKITIEQGLSREHVLGQLGIVDIFNTTWKSSASFELLYNDLTFKNYVFNNTALAMSLSLTRSDITIGTASNPTLTFTFQPGYFTKWNKNVQKDNLVSQTSDYMGVYSIANAGQCTATLTNTVPTY